MTTATTTSSAADWGPEVTADPPGQRRSLTGRAAELALIEEFLDRAAAEGGSLVLAGEPGVGKTALLQVAADRAMIAGTRVVRAEGVEFETTGVFSGLSQILHPPVGRPGDAPARAPGHAGRRAGRGRR